jgi:hypothetical protein
MHLRIKYKSRIHLKVRCLGLRLRLLESFKGKVFRVKVKVIRVKAEFKVRVKVESI